MSHRLFHTLVLSGAALVEGCATTSPTPAVASPARTARAEAPTRAPEPTPAAAPAPSEEEVRAMVADARVCDAAWPTTKSASLYRPRTVALNGRTYACIVRPDRPTQCCIQEPAR